jgi:hypothetical protein
MVNIHASVGDLCIVNARENSAIMEEITSQGLDIDQGMVLKMGGQLYYGARCNSRAGPHRQSIGHIQSTQLLDV